MTKRHLAVLAIAASLISLTGCAGSYSNRIPGSYASAFKRGSDAVRAKDYDRAAEEYAFAASSGHPRTLIAYGRLFASGTGVEQDPARAAALLQEAYEKSSNYKGQAALELASVYMEGGEGPSGTLQQDEVRAEALYVEALERGETRAASKLGRIYEAGLGVEADADKAIDYYRKAPANDAFGARNLAMLLAKTGAPEDQVARAAERAVEQFETRAEKGNRGAWVQLAEIYSRGEIMEADPERAKDYLQNVSEPEDPGMQLRLARLYDRIGERRDRNRMLRLAADGGDVKAQTQLAKLFLRPRTDDTNGAVGRYYAERAIGQGSEDAMVFLGLALLRGEVLDPDPVSGEILLRRASQSGNLRAAASLGVSILRGDVGERTPGEAMTLLEEAANQGSGEAMSALGFAYLKGNGLPKNEVLAQEWIEKAAAAGSSRAKRFLAEQPGA